MRIVLGRGGERWSNCIFSTVELPEETPPDTRTRDSFQAGQQIWGRCYLPAPLGDGRVVDVITVDGKPGWEQAYPSAKGGSRTGGRSRSVAFSEVLRIQLAGLAAGPHRIVVEGSLRRGKRTTKLYEGEFRYVR